MFKRFSLLFEQYSDKSSTNVTNFPLANWKNYW
jgi:hypothetical protein